MDDPWIQHLPEVTDPSSAVMVSSVSSDACEDTSPSAVDCQLLSRIISIVKMHRPQGIDLMDICREFYKMFQTKLSPNQYCGTGIDQFRSIYQFCKYLETETNGSLVVAEPDAQNHLKSERLFLDERAYAEWLKNFKIDNNLFILESLAKPLLPMDVVLQHETRLNLATLPSEAIKDLSIVAYSVDVVHVVTPNEVYVRFTRNKEIYQKIKKRLRFYDGDQDISLQYALPQELALPGYVCAVRNPLDWDNWHRAIIISTTTEFVTLYAIDFGNIITEERKDLRLLKKKMFEEAPQVHRVSLFGVAPPKGRKCWSQEAVDYLQAIVHRKRSYGRNPHSVYKQMKCSFLYKLSHFGGQVFSVFLFYHVQVKKENIAHRMSVFLHEKLVQTGLARIIHDDFSLSLLEGVSDQSVSRAIEEPLLAIKNEPYFEEYGSPSKSMNDNKALKLEAIDRSDKLTEGQTPKKPTNDSAINYKKFFLIDNGSLELKMHKYFSGDNGLMFTERNLITEGHPKLSPVYEVKYLNEDMNKKLLEGLRRMYLNEANSKPNEFRKFIKSPDTDCIRTGIPRDCQQLATNFFAPQLDSAFVKYLSH